MWVELNLEQKECTGGIQDKGEFQGEAKSEWWCSNAVPSTAFLSVTLENHCTSFNTHLGQTVLLLFSCPSPLFGLIWPGWEVGIGEKWCWQPKCYCPERDSTERLHRKIHVRYQRNGLERSDLLEKEENRASNNLSAWGVASSKGVLFHRPH